MIFPRRKASTPVIATASISKIAEAV